MKYKIIIFVPVIAIILAGALFYLNNSGDQPGTASATHISQFFKEAGLISDNIDSFQNSGEIDLESIYGGVAPHHIPTAIPILAEFYSKLKQARDVDTFIILGPDHFEKSRGDISVSRAEFVTPFGTLSPNLEIINELEKTGLVVNDEIPFDDHSIHSQLLFIGKLFPNAKIVPIVFRSSSTNEIAEILGEKLSSLATPNTFVVASVDFSHYLNKNQALPLDNQSAAMLTQLEPKLAGLAEADSPQSLVALISAVKKMGADTSISLGTYNSAEYSSIQDYTTGYVVQFFGTKKEELSKTGGATMIFTGDIMLSRSVGDLMEKQGDYNLPFANIADFLKNADLAFGNLENPVSSRGKKVGSIYSFRADPRVVEGLKYAGFDILSIANNHMWDYGREAFLDTMTHLTGAGIDFTGGGLNFEEAHRPVVKNVKGTRVAFLAYTEFLQSAVAGNESAGITNWNSEQIKKDIITAKQQSDLVVVSFHWGDEYQTNHNPKQEQFAKAAIDAGADLIIGHHPHVIQEVEQYKNGWIAYSLGNFIFDQQFSEATTSGLMLEVTIENDEIKDVNKIGVKINRDFQPTM
ncbi:MAG: AmmeMemoRadiSam system protein B [bacterium]|nr:AmmeMemoRadiSam system protein B [bacterium]